VSPFESYGPFKEPLIAPSQPDPPRDTVPFMPQPLAEACLLLALLVIPRAAAAPAAPVRLSVLVIALDDLRVNLGYAYRDDALSESENPANASTETNRLRQLAARLLRPSSSTP